jgi:hypothetical protein
MSQIRGIAGNVLPRAEVKKHLLWRYSLVWEKEEPRTPSLLGLKL